MCQVLSAETANVRQVSGFATLKFHRKVAILLRQNLQNDNLNYNR